MDIWNGSCKLIRWTVNNGVSKLQFIVRLFVSKKSKSVRKFKLLAFEGTSWKLRWQTFVVSHTISDKSFDNYIILLLLFRNCSFRQFSGWKTDFPMASFIAFVIIICYLLTLRAKETSNEFHWKLSQNSFITCFLSFFK